MIWTIFSCTRAILIETNESYRRTQSFCQFWLVFQFGANQNDETETEVELMSRPRHLRTHVSTERLFRVDNCGFQEAVIIDVVRRCGAYILPIQNRLSIESHNILNSMGVLSFWFSELPKLVAHHYSAGNLNWPMIVYISLVHIVAIVGLLKIPAASADTLLWAFILWPIRYVAPLPWNGFVRPPRFDTIRFRLTIAFLLTQWLWYYRWSS